MVVAPRLEATEGGHRGGIPGLGERDFGMAFTAIGTKKGRRAKLFDTKTVAREYSVGSEHEASALSHNSLRCIELSKYRLYGTGIILLFMIMRSRHIFLKRIRNRITHRIETEESYDPH